MTIEDGTRGDPISRWIDGSEKDALMRVSTAEAEASLLRLLNEQELAYPDVDSDRMARAGYALQMAGHHGAPATAMAWLRQQPTEDRLVVVLCLLLTSWGNATGPAAPAPELVEELWSLVALAQPSLELENGLLIVLGRALHSGLPSPLAERVVDYLDQARRTPGRHEHMIECLDQFVARYRSEGPKPA